MEYVVLDGTRYACPFAALFSPLTDDEGAYLRQSVAELGIHNPVLTYDSPTVGPALIQGRNRVRLGQQLGVDVPHIHLGKMDDETACKIAHDIQAAGRMLTPGQVEQARRNRAKKAQEMATAGMSQRTIASTLHTSQPTVQRVLRSEQATGDSHESPEPPPDSRAHSPTVQGRDGKTYHQAPKATASRVPTADEEAAFARECVLRAKALLVRLVGEFDALLAGSMGDAVRAAAKQLRSHLGTDVDAWGPVVTMRAILDAAGK